MRTTIQIRIILFQLIGYIINHIDGFHHGCIQSIDTCFVGSLFSNPTALDSKYGMTPVSRGNLVSQLNMRQKQNHNYDPHSEDEYLSIRKEQIPFDPHHHGMDEQTQQNKRNRLRAKVISPSKRFSRKTRFSLNRPVQIMYMQSTSSAYSSSSRPPQSSKDSSRHSRISSPQQYTSPYFSKLRRRNQMELNISTGLTFDDGDQLLISAQKPLGIILEEREGDSMITSMSGCVVAEVVSNGEADKAGVKVGDILVAVQNQDVSASSLEDVMSRIGNVPRVVNLRFWRRER